MHVRAMKMILWATAAALAGGAVLLVGWSAGPVGAPSTVPPAPRPAHAAGDGSVLPPVSAFEPLWGLELRRPLVDAAPASAGAANPEQPDGPPGLRLRGTIVEPDHSMAVFASVRGSEWKSVGDDIDGARVIAIGPESATVEYDGRTITVAVEKPGAPSPAAPSALSAPAGAGTPEVPTSAPAPGEAAAGAPSAAAGAPSAPMLVPMPDYEEPH